MAAIFNYQHTQTSNSINIFTACFVALKTCWKRIERIENLWNFVAVMYISWNTCNYIISAAILDFWLPVSFGSVTDNTIEQFDPENTRAAVEIVFLASLEAEILWG